MAFGGIVRGIEGSDKGEFLTPVQCLNQHGVAIVGFCVIPALPLYYIFSRDHKYLCHFDKIDRLVLGASKFVVPSINNVIIKYDTLNVREVDECFLRFMYTAIFLIMILLICFMIAIIYRNKHIIIRDKTKHIILFFVLSVFGSTFPAGTLSKAGFVQLYFSNDGVFIFNQVIFYSTIAITMAFTIINLIIIVGSIVRRKNRATE